MHHEHHKGDEREVYHFSGRTTTENDSQPGELLHVEGSSQQVEAAILQFSKGREIRPDLTSTMRWRSMCRWQNGSSRS